MKPFISTLFIAAGLLALPSLSHAQFSNSAASTILDADQVYTDKGVFTLVGQADIRQGDVRLLADKVEIYTEDESGRLISSSEFTRIVATGNFYYITPEQEVRGDRGVYTRENDTFVVTGDVVLLQDGSVVTGDRLDYNLETRDAKVKGKCDGRRCAKGRRVSILLRSTDSGQGTN